MAVKRKYEPPSTADESALRSTRSNRQQQQQLEVLLSNAQKLLFRALKTARGFERQKLGRRQKTANGSGDDEEKARLDAEIIALKKLDLASNAKLYLYKTLARTNSVASHAALPSSILAEARVTGPPQDAAYVNVTARLYSSNPVRKAMDEAMKDVRGALGILDSKERPKKRLRKADHEATEATEHGNALAAGAEAAAPAETVDGQGGSSSNAESDIFGIEADDVAAESEADRKVDDHGRYASWPASSSSDEGSEDYRNPPATQSKAGPEIKAGNRTTFLPTLAAGYISGSDSDADANSGISELQARRNRRGQRARQLIWARKYGANAKHVKQRQQEERQQQRKWGQGRDHGRDARSGAQAGSGRGRKEREARGPTGANSEAIKPREGKKAGGGEKGTLHPSWEAAKRRKEEQKKKTGTVFKGKKVVFE